MKKVIYIFLFIFVCLLLSCRDPKDKKCNLPQFVDGYLDYTDIFLTESSSKNIVLRVSDAHYVCGRFGFNASYLNTTMYDSLSKSNGDTSFFGCRVFFPNSYFIEGPLRLLFCSDVININIISSQDFDANHLAGTSLNDVVNLLSASMYPFICSKYQNTFNWTQSILDSMYNIEQDWLHYMFPNMHHYYYHPIYKSIDEIMPSNYRNMMAIVEEMYEENIENLANLPLCFLHFKQAPTLAQMHDLTITITLNDGRVFEKTITKTFSD